MSSNDDYATGCALIFVLAVGLVWIIGTWQAFAGTADEDIGIVYLICTVLIGIFLLFCCSSKDIDEAKKRLSEKKTQLQKLREQKTSLLSE